MNITKKQWTIIGIIVAVILVWYFFLRKKTSEKNLVKRNIIISGKPQAFIPGAEHGVVKPATKGQPTIQGNQDTAESNWEPEYRDINKDKAALSGISLANISTFGTPI